MADMIVNEHIYPNSTMEGEVRRLIDAGFKGEELASALRAISDAKVAVDVRIHEIDSERVSAVCAAVGVVCSEIGRVLIECSRIDAESRVRVAEINAGAKKKE